MGSFNSFHSIESPLIWASGNERLYFYFLTFFNTVNSQVRKYFNEDILGFLQNQIEEWDGSQTIDAKSFEKQFSELSRAVRPIARILHLACFSPFKIQESHINQFHSLHQGKDKALLAAVSWSSFMTSCRIGRELYRPYRD